MKAHLLDLTFIQPSPDNTTCPVPGSCFSSFVENTKGQDFFQLSLIPYNTGLLQIV